jgi:ATP-dependent RNA helicase DeaD
MNEVPETSQSPAPASMLFSNILPESPLLSRMSELGFTTPTDIQALAIQKALEGKDLILKAKTGSGKTFAFVLPLLQRFSELGKNKEETTALFIAPTRELAVQIQEVIQELDTSLSPVLVIGGVDERKQKKAIEEDARIIVGTPGRLKDLMQKKIISLKKCKYFVLDEADEMLSMGFIEDIRAILSKLPKKRQGLFVSATISPRVEMLAHSFLVKSEYILSESNDENEPNIEHFYCEVGGELLSKALALCDIIETQNPRSAIIFCNTKAETEFVEILLRRRGFDARRMNSDLSQSQRQKVITKIKADELHLLVATDIAARGIDINELDLVVHYSLHDQPDTYTHRTGRTGRAGHEGRAISIVGPREYGAFHYLTKALDVTFQKIELPTDEDVANARLVHLYKKLRENDDKLDTRVLLSAKKLLQDHGETEEANEELLETIGRLLEFTLAHSVAEEAKSLDEELQQQSEKESRNNSRDQSQGRDREGRGHAEGRGREGRGHSERNRNDRERPQDKGGRNERSSDTRQSRQPEPSRKENTERKRRRPARKSTSSEE